MSQQPNIRLPPKWIELNIMKRECATFLATLGEDMMCQCGRRKNDHKDFVKHQHRPETWSPAIHTKTFNTDAYGAIMFEGEHHPNKAHYVRLSYDTSPEIIVQLMTYVWNLEMPQLLISVRGGSTNFEMSPRLGKIFQAGIIKATRNTNAWIFSNGLNSGVSKHLGVALAHEKWAVGGGRRKRIVSVGMAPWGMIENRNDLLGRNRDRTYSPLDHANSRFIHLNPRHSNFLLVDNGSVGKFGGENYLRRRLEKCIATYPTSPNRSCDTPVIVIVVEGGFYTLCQVSDYLNDEPPIPVVIFAGTGRSADLISWVVRKVHSEVEYDNMKEIIYQKIVHLFQLNNDSQCEILYQELRNIFLRRNLITVYNPHSTSQEEEFDGVILSSIFRSQHWTPLEQLSLTLVWNRVDIAQTEVFIYGRDWSRDHLEHAMMEALVSNRIDFVTLLLEHGLNMQTFLTANRLEALYSLENIPSKVLGALLMDFAQIRVTNRKRNKADIRKADLTLHHIGIALSHMMGHIYRSNYVHMKTKLHCPTGNELDSPDVRGQTFARPFDDLFVWAVLTKRHELAKLLWVHGHGALAKSLVAVKLNKYLASALSRLMTTLGDEFESNAEEWESLSLSLLDSCFRQDSKMARQLLTMELENWSQQTCLALGVMANHRMLLGHPCCQILLADLWMGALNIRSKTSLKIILGIILPPLAIAWEYKSKEELKLLPHQEKDFPYDIVHNHRDLDEEVEVEHALQMRDFDLEKNYRVPVPGMPSASTCVGNTSARSVTSVFRNRFKGRKTDLAEVVSKIDFGSNRGVPAPGYFDNEAGEALSKSSLQSTIVGEVGAASFTNLHKPRILPVGVVRESSGISSFVTTQHSLKPFEKFIEFQKAPVTNFYRHTIAYLVFLIALIYVILYPQDRYSVGWMEIYVISYWITLGLECIREFIIIDALSFSKRVARMKQYVWIVTDFSVILFCLAGTVLRLTISFNYGMLMYRISSMYWNMRLYKYLGVHRFIGPKIVMMSRMFTHMACFGMIILVVILSFGVAREAIQFPDLNPTWADLAEALLEPYVMMFGEVELSSISPQCDKDGDCPLGAWLIPICWVVYMMVSNVLIVNVLIAVFNGIYAEVDAQAVEIWMFQRFTFVMEFEQKPVLPPPFIIICHVLSLIRFAFRKCVRCMCEEQLLEQNHDDDKSHVITENDQNLKSFLSPTEQHMVFDFEEENVDLIRHLLSAKDQQATTSFGTEVMLSYHVAGSPFSPDKSTMPMQQLKSSLKELYNDMEVQKAKLDKLVEIWEMEMSDNGLNGDSNDNEDSLAISSTSSLALGPVKQACNRQAQTCSIKPRDIAPTGSNH